MTEKNQEKLRLALKELQYERQRARKIVEWINLRVYNYEYGDTLTEDDIEIWLEAIRSKSYMSLKKWAENNIRKDHAAKQRGDFF